MSFRDTGDFSLLYEISRASVAASFGDTRLRFGTQLPGVAFDEMGVAGVYTTGLGDFRFEFIAPDLMVIRFDCGTGITFTEFELNGTRQPIPEHLQFAPFGAEANVTVRIVLPAGGDRIDIDFQAPLPPRFEPVLLRDTSADFQSSAPVQFLRQEALLTGDNAFDIRIRNYFFERIRTAIRDAFSRLPPMPIYLARPRGTAGVAIAAFRVETEKLVVYMRFPGVTTGDPATATVPHLRVGETGAAVISNDAVLAEIVRPMVSVALGLPAGGFVAGHPCSWSGRVSPPRHAAPLETNAISSELPDSVTAVTAVHAGIDDAGTIHVLTTIVSSLLGGGAIVTAVADTTFAATAVSDRSRPLLFPGTGGVRAPLRVRLARIGSTSAIDIAVQWWVYLLAASPAPLIGAVKLAALLVGGTAVVDAAAGHRLFATDIDRYLNRIFAGGAQTFFPSAAAHLPAAVGTPPALTVTNLAKFQADADLRDFPNPGGGFGPALTDPFRKHHLIANVK